mgnify:CR=1 FL=1
MTDQPLWHGRFEASPAESLLRFTERSKSFEKLSILEKIAKSNVIGVLGGAGPLASVDFCELLNNFGIEYINYTNKLSKIIYNFLK